MIRVLFFGSLGDRLEQDQMLVDADALLLKTVGDLRSQLIQDGCEAVADERILSACNQNICGGDQRIKDGDEIAFFPPVTGG